MKADKVYFIHFAEGWFIVTPHANKKKVPCRASTLPAAMQWISRQLQESR